MGAEPETIRVLIADDCPQVRESLQALLETLEGITVVGQARDGQEAVAMAASLRPQVVVMDLEMPGTDGLAATSLVKAGSWQPAIIVLTIHAQPWAQAQALQAGADAFVSKSAMPEVLIQSIRRVASHHARPEPRSPD